MVIKYQTSNDKIPCDENIPKWGLPSLSATHKSHGFLIVPRHPRAIAQEQERRERADNPLKNPKPVTADEQSLKESFDRGYQQATEELQQKITDEKTKYNELEKNRDKSLSLIDALNEALDNNREDIEKNIKEVALRFLKEDKKGHVQFVEEQIHNYLKSHKIYKIYVSEELIEQWKEFLPDYAEFFVPQKTLEDIECVINFDDFFLDGRFEALLRSESPSETDLGSNKS